MEHIQEPKEVHLPSTQTWPDSFKRQATEITHLVQAKSMWAASYPTPNKRIAAQVL